MTFRSATCGHPMPDTATFCPECCTTVGERPFDADTSRDRGAPLPPPPAMPWPPPVAYVAQQRIAYRPEHFDAVPPPGPSRRTRAIAMAILAVVPIVAVSMVWYYARMPTTAVSQPKQWDPRVAAIAEFVERERGLTFEHPVAVEFLTPDRYRAVAIAGDEANTSVDVMTDDEAVAEFRAMGLISGRVDLGAAGDMLVGSGTLAFYSPRDKRVRVRGTEMTPRLRVTLAHELTHALQDQNFDLAGDQSRERTLRPIVEGDARRIEHAFAATVLTEAERAELATADEAGRSAYETQLAASQVPGVLSTSFELPYAVGPQFVAIVAAKGGNAAVDALIRRPPSSEVALLDPLGTDVDSPIAFAANPWIPPEAAVLDRTPMGAGLLFLLLGERMEPAAALDAAITWRGEELVVSRQEGRVCVDAHIMTARTTSALLVGLKVWAADMPAQAGAQVSGDAHELWVHACDPGADVAFVVASRTEQTLSFVAIRSEIELELMRDADMTAQRSACIADGASRTISAADLAADGFDVMDDPQLTGAIQRAALTC